MKAFDQQEYHRSVLLKESVDFLNIVPNGTYIDVTFGGGGHSREILNRLGPDGNIIAFDQDIDAIENEIDDDRLFLIHANFRYIKRFLRYYAIDSVDGIIADLGVSSHHFDSSERGFSFKYESDLDMRMNRNATMTATDILNEYEEERLASIFWSYGELKIASQLAKAVVQFRETKSFKTTNDLVEVLKPFSKRDRQRKLFAQAFQALRIEVNGELEALKQMLQQSVGLLGKGGRIVVISYHSLEDRIVKNFFKTGNFDGKQNEDFYGNIITPFKIITRKAVVPSDIESEQNSRSRSAKLRAAEKL